MHSNKGMIILISLGNTEKLQVSKAFSVLKHTCSASIQSINPILIRVYPRKRGWSDLPRFGSNFSNSYSASRSIYGILFLHTNTGSCSPSPLASSTSSLVVLASSCPSLQTPKLFSKHAHHPSLTHAHTISLHSPLPSEPLFPLIPTSHSVYFINRFIICILTVFLAVVILVPLIFK